MVSSLDGSKLEEKFEQSITVSGLKSWNRSCYPKHPKLNWKTTRSFSIPEIYTLENLSLCKFSFVEFRPPINIADDSERYYNLSWNISRRTFRHHFLNTINMMMSIISVLNLSLRSFHQCLFADWILLLNSVNFRSSLPVPVNPIAD